MFPVTKPEDSLRAARRADCGFTAVLPKARIKGSAASDSPELIDITAHATLAQVEAVARYVGTRGSLHFSSEYTIARNSGSKSYLVNAVKLRR